MKTRFKCNKSRLIRLLPAALMLTVLLAAGCGSQNQFVLLPDPDGHVGKLSVSNESGELILDKAGESTTAAAGEAPTDPAILDQESIEATYGEALAAAPERPVTFLLYFKSGGAVLTAESEAMLTEIQAVIKTRDSNDISVVGHTDRVGAADVNAALSLKRAETVADWLVNGGVNRDIIEITSHGEENPVIPTEDNVAEPKNRRVEVTVR